MTITTVPLRPVATIELVGSFTARHVESGTTVDLTGRRNRSTTKSPLPVLCRELLAHGLDPETRAHVIRKALDSDGFIPVFKRDRTIAVWAGLDAVESETRSVHVEKHRPYRGPVKGMGRQEVNRIQNWVIAKGYGKRNRRKSDGMPFDVVSSEGVRWIAEHLEAAKKAVEEKTSGPAKEAREALREFQKHRSSPLGGQQEVHWVADHFPHLTHDQMAQALSLSRQLVTRFMRIRSDQIANAKALRERHREPTGDTSRCVAQ